MIDFKSLEPENKTECKGLFYRAEFSSYLNHNGHYVETKRVRPLKRMSCKGCDNCEGLLEYLREDVSCDRPPELPDTFNHGSTYQLEVIDYSRDWESGYVDELTLGFVEIKESN